MAAAPWAFVAIPPATIVFLPFISASKPCFAIMSGSSSDWFRPWFLAVGPGMGEVRVMPLSVSSFCRASVQDCRKDFGRVVV